MRPLDIHEQVKKRPFLPLRLHFSDGPFFDIRHPEQITVTRMVLAITVLGRNRGTLPERVILCDPMHLVRLEPIDGEPATS